MEPDPFIVLFLYPIMVYFIVLFISIFVVLPYLVAKGYLLNKSVNVFNNPIKDAIYFCLCWPATYTFAIIYYLIIWCVVCPFKWLIIHPSKCLFDQVVRLYTSKPETKIISEPIQLEINESKTGYRNVEFRK